MERPTPIFEQEDCEAVQALLDVLDAAQRGNDSMICIRGEDAEDMETVLRVVLDKMMDAC